MWRDEGLWKPRAEMTDDQQAALDGREFERDQLVSTQQQLNPGANITVGPIFDASQLAPHEWPGDVIDLRTRK